MKKQFRLRPGLKQRLLNTNHGEYHLEFKCKKHVRLVMRLNQALCAAAQNYVRDQLANCLTWPRQLIFNCGQLVLTA